MGLGHSLECFIVTLIFLNFEVTRSNYFPLANLNAFCFVDPVVVLGCVISFQLYFMQSERQEFPFKVGKI
jgi:hypothetical protein